MVHGTAIGAINLSQPASFDETLEGGKNLLGARGASGEIDGGRSSDFSSLVALSRLAWLTVGFDS